MRRTTLFPLLAALSLAFASCAEKPDREPPPPPPPPLAVSAPTSALNASYQELLDAYFALSDALAEDRLAAATDAARRLSAQAGALPLNGIQGDSTGMIRETAGFFASNLQAAAGELAASAELGTGRQKLEAATDALWSLTRTIRYEGAPLYYLYCPMAFDHKGAYWISASRDIRNPYFGQEMPRCGEVADSLDYRTQ